MKHVLLAISLVFCLSTYACAEGRLALLIGNAAYEHAPVLINADDDANALAETFTGLGFNVSVVIDANEAELRKAVTEFANAAKGADIVAVYYAGHGFVSNGEDFLLPTDFDPSKETTALANVIGISDLLRTLEPTGATMLAFIDTNRTAAFEGEAASGSAGFTPSRTGGGLILSFSTRLGGVALDGKDGHSPYAAALLKHIGTPGSDVKNILVEVRETVYRATEGKQTPWYYSTLNKPLVLKPQ